MTRILTEIKNGEVLVQTFIYNNRFFRTKAEYRIDAQIDSDGIMGKVYRRDDGVPVVDGTATFDTLVSMGYIEEIGSDRVQTDTYLELERWITRWRRSVMQPPHANYEAELELCDDEILARCKLIVQAAER